MDVKSVLETLSRVGLTVKLSKCRFAKGIAMYLGHQIGSGRHAPDLVRVKAIQTMERPKTKKELKSFLGLMNYYRDHIANHAEVVMPLTARTGNRTPNVLPWGDEEEQAFQKAKRLLVVVPVMRAPDASQPFVLSTDASDRAIGACLAQSADDGKEYPVAFLSKKRTAPQTRWAVIEREAYAVVWALGPLETWLFGAEVEIRTDHNTLQYLASAARNSARLTRGCLRCKTLT